MEYLKIFLAAVFVSNFVLALFLGLCPFIGVSKRLDSALGMGMAVIFVMTLASLVTYTLYSLVLVPTGTADFLNIVVFIVVIASLVQFVEMVLQKSVPALYRALGIYLPLITTNCAVLGVTQLNVNKFPAGTEMGVFLPGLLKATLYGLASGVGFTLALLLMSGIRELLDEADVPKPFKGVPVAFVVAACLALAFLGFSGMV